MEDVNNYILVSLKNGDITNIQVFKDKDKAIKVANQHEVDYLHDYTDKFEESLFVFNPQDGFVKKMFSVIK